MVEALLMEGVCEIVVDRPAIVDHLACIVAAEDAGGDGAGTGRVNDVGSGLFADDGVEPGLGAADVPTGFVGHDPRSGFDGCADFLVDRLGAPGGAEHDLDAAATRDRDAEEGFEDAADLAVRHAGLLVELDDRRLGVGAELGGGGAEGVGGLQGMPALKAPLALRTTTDMDVELPLNGPPWDLDLILLIDACQGDRSAAIGAGFGQGRLVDFVDFGGRLAMRLGAIIVARLATGLSRLILRFALGERRGLPLAGPAGFFEESRQFGDFRPQIGDLPFETQTVEARCNHHAFTLSRSKTFSCASSSEKWKRSRATR